MTQQNAVPAKAVTEDHRLEQSASKASEALAKHRWHWTLDESNPDRVSIRAYAKAVGRSFSAVQGHATGYASWVKADQQVLIGESIQRARMGGETEAATEAVAKARGNSFTHTRHNRHTEVKRVREIARDRAEEHGTTVEEEAPKAAEWIVKTEKAAARQTEQRKERLGLRFVEMERHLDKAKRALTDAVNMAHEVPWGDEERDLLTNTVSNVRSLLGLIDVALSGSSGTDFDAELERLLSGGAR